MKQKKRKTKTKHWMEERLLAVVPARLLHGPFFFRIMGIRTGRRTGFAKLPMVRPHTCDWSIGEPGDGGRNGEGCITKAYKHTSIQA